MQYSVIIDIDIDITHAKKNAVYAIVTHRRDSSRFEPSNAYSDMKRRVIDKLKAYFDRFNGMNAA